MLEEGFLLCLLISGTDHCNTRLLLQVYLHFLFLISSILLIVLVMFRLSLLSHCVLDLNRQDMLIAHSIEEIAPSHNLFPQVVTFIIYSYSFLSTVLN